MSRVMIVELRTRGRLAALFQTEGFEVETVGTLDRLESMMAAFAPELMMLELPAIDEQAVMLCEALATMTPAPVVVLCEHCDETDVVAGYGAGAAAVLTDATGPRELVARIRALLRRRPLESNLESEVLIVGPVSLDRSCRQVTVGGRLIPMPRREFDIAEALMRRAGTVVTRHSLLMELWGGSHRDSKTLDVQVGRLRARLAAAEGRRRILTVRGVGYRFVTDEDLARGVLAHSEAQGTGA
jgi:two-component system response regulator RegX3